MNGQGDQNILVNVFFSLGMGFALLIMGIDIDLDQVMEAVRLNDQSNMIETLANNIKHARCIHIYSSPSKIMQCRGSRSLGSPRPRPVRPQRSKWNEIANTVWNF